MICEHVNLFWLTEGVLLLACIVLGGTLVGIGIADVALKFCRKGPMPRAKAGS
jgi:hypothetical protein